MCTCTGGSSGGSGNGGRDDGGVTTGGGEWEAEGPRIHVRGSLSLRQVAADVPAYNAMRVVLRTGRRPIKRSARATQAGPHPGVQA